MSIELICKSLSNGYDVLEESQSTGSNHLDNMVIKAHKLYYTSCHTNHTSFSLAFPKSLQRKSKLKDCKTAKRKTGAEGEKNRTTEKGEFFRGTSATQIKKL